MAALPPEGDTLVIDTVGVKTDRPYAMIDLFGTSHTKSLHVVERYRLREYDDVKDARAPARQLLLLCHTRDNSGRGYSLFGS
jgi:hypothetical protein